jgi:hypothetical protein
MAIFVSKMSHCLYDLLARYAADEWHVEIPLIISNHPDMESQYLIYKTEEQAAKDIQECINDIKMIGFDLDEIINMFRFKRNKSLASLQQRLLQQEEDKYIDHRFSMAFVRKVTKLNSPELEEFMKEYRPDYEIVQRMNDLELGYFIEKNFEEYRNKKYNKGAPRKY